MAILRFVTGSFLVIALYCSIDPFKLSSIADFPDFEAYRVDFPAWSTFPTFGDEKNLLQRSEIKFLNQVEGPESVAFDPKGRGPYVGVADGRILMWNGNSWSDFAFTSSNRSALCDPKPSPTEYLKNEHVCGRPLGLRFDKRTGELYIADAYFGLLKVGEEGGLATSLLTEVNGVPLRFTNDLDIDNEGNVYFTDSSTKYQRRNFIQLVFSAEKTGRLLKYNIVTKEATVLMQNLQFPNGVSLSKDQSFFVFSEGALGQLRRYWIKGEKAGTSEIFTVLPGFPDNIRTNEKGEFWVAIHCRRNTYSHLAGLYPQVRKFFLKLPIPAKYQFRVQIGGRPHAMAIKYDPNGEMLQVLEDRDGKVVRSISEVEEKDGKLWMGSVLMPFIATYDLN